MIEALKLCLLIAAMGFSFGIAFCAALQIYVTVGEWLCEWSCRLRRARDVRRSRK